ncbi:pseudouridine synthase [Lysobacter korlensis]|uniref:Pseudouridine synthase n=1 Tax=Lysobacter korlensis TaxID=553636 RepID=A0ABV6RJZ1_9GAMM
MRKPPARRPRAAANAGAPAPRRHGLARTLSKAGVCSRSEAVRWIEAGRVRVNGRVVRDPEFPVVQGRERLEIEGIDAPAGPRLYVMLNKPRGLVTTARDERGRETVYRCFDGEALPWLAPVGRLDQASEGLLLFSNDPEWAARVTAPETGPSKTYHVQVDTVPGAEVLAALERGVIENGEPLRASSVRTLRTGAKNAWLEIVLDEGRNRQIRRLLAANGIGVLRLVRVAIGSLQLGELPKGQWRMLENSEIEALAAPSSLAAPVGS